VFGDNNQHYGLGGAALLRTAPNSYGFVTKWKPDMHEDSFYTIIEYNFVYQRELTKLIYELEDHPDKIYLISKLGAGLANKHRIFEAIIEPRMKKDLAQYQNVQFLW